MTGSYTIFLAFTALVETRLLEGLVKGRKVEK